MNKQRLVQEFMEKAGQPINNKPQVPSLEIRILLAKLVLEEALEFARAQGLIVSNYSHHIDMDSLGFKEATTREPDMVKTADALADLLYVVYGAGVSWGIQLDPIFSEVHHANMEKFGPGSYKRADGKWMKPPGWVPPNIKLLLEIQSYEANDPYYIPSSSDAGQHERSI